MHKKYTYKNGKRFGPYLYENKRVNGKVVTRYVGLSEEKKNYFGILTKNSLPIYILASILVLFFVLSFILDSGSPTGKASFEVSETHYNQGDILSGVIKFNLKSGEFIPADSIVKVKLDGEEREFILKDIVYESSNEGDFYAENTEISGSGEGYGVVGEHVFYPEIGFDLEIVKNENESEIVSGIVSKGNDFVYSENYEDFSIVDGSVTLDGEPVDFTSIVVDESGDEIVITTDYERVEEGYGEEFLGDFEYELEMEMEEFNITAVEDVLIVDLIYEGEVIASAEEEIVIDNKEKVNEENDNEDTDEVVTNQDSDYNVSDEEIGKSNPISLIKDIPQIKVPAGRDVSINLEDFFSGADSYVFEGDVLVYINGSIFTISQTQDFKGSREGKIVARAAEYELEGNEFEILVSSGNIEVKTSNSVIKVGEKVKWKKNVSLEIPEQIIVEIPEQAENVEVKKIENGNEFEANADVSGLTGNVVIEIDLEENKKESEPFLTKVFKNIFSVFTGKVVSEIDSEGGVKEVVISDSATDYVIEYETPAPEAFEYQSDSGKTVVISAPDELGYTDVLSFSDVPEIYSMGQESQIKIYWKEGEQYMPFDAYDLDFDNLIDYVEWITPHLSNQTFEIIYIYVSKASHLDSGREFIEDIYSEVSERDYNYKIIPAGDYVRVTFERNLTSSNDITLYAKASCQIDSFIEINGEQVPCEIYLKKIRIDDIRRELE